MEEAPASLGSLCSLQVRQRAEQPLSVIPQAAECRVTVAAEPAPEGTGAVIMVTLHRPGLLANLAPIWGRPGAEPGFFYVTCGLSVALVALVSPVLRSASLRLVELAKAAQGARRAAALARALGHG